MANAVADALSPFGVTITRLPLTPSAIVALLEGARPAEHSVPARGTRPAQDAAPVGRADGPARTYGHNA